jgi:hypothetical protein
MLSADANGAAAQRWFSDGRGDLEDELRRYACCASVHR